MATAKTYYMPVTRPQAEKLIILDSILNKSGGLVDFALDRGFDNDKLQTAAESLTGFMKSAINATKRGNGVDQKELDKLFLTIYQTLKREAQQGNVSVVDGEQALKKLIKMFNVKVPEHMTW